ncbi:MAG TPA: cytochrome c oxidase subunit 3 [Tepidisphaeraceae bacterium]|nr:cytochrome c oxidase subunit 3 [Tepidisphaeraceae bacterium]
MSTDPNDPPADDSRPETPALRPPGDGKRSLGAFGMWLFLAALFMLFAASIVGYVIIRNQATRLPEAPIKGAATRPIVPLQSLQFPTTLWVSTVLVIGVSVAMWVAHAYFRRGLQRPYRKALIAALALGAGFVTVQTPAMIQLIKTNQAAMAQRHHFYMLVFFLVLLHALHVLGGMIALARLALRSQHGGYDPANPDPVTLVGMYWHFLDLIWIVMFGTFVLMK